VAEYLPDFYGPMTDGINRDHDSDRILVHWLLASSRVAEACAGTPVRPVLPPGAAASWVHVPHDIESLRVTDNEQARSWRTKVREQLLGALTAGGHVAGFDKEQGYLVLPHEGGDHS
jgi:predicted GNAT superfamily acetyltransferase